MKSKLLVSMASVSVFAALSGQYNPQPPGPCYLEAFQPGSPCDFWPGLNSGYCCDGPLQQTGSVMTLYGVNGYPGRTNAVWNGYEACFCHAGFETSEGCESLGDDQFFFILVNDWYADGAFCETDPG